MTGIGAKHEFKGIYVDTWMISIHHSGMISKEIVAMSNWLGLRRKYSKKNHSRMMPVSILGNFSSSSKYLVLLSYYIKFIISMYVLNSLNINTYKYTLCE